MAESNKARLPMPCFISSSTVVSPAFSLSRLMISLYSLFSIFFSISFLSESVRIDPKSSIAVSIQANFLSLSLSAVVWKESICSMSQSCELSTSRGIYIYLIPMQAYHFEYSADDI